MKRRSFIKNMVGATVAQVAFSGLTLKVRASEMAWLASMANATNNNILVIIQLAGGNDGLNMLPPLDQMSKYLSLRPTIGLAENTILPLGTTGVGLHPSLTGLKGLYDDNLMAVVQGLGYSGQSFSHFAASKIWQVGINNTQEGTGWMGRFLGNQYPDFPAATYTDPIAIQVSDLTSTLFVGETETLSSTYNSATINSLIANPLTPVGGSTIGAGNSNLSSCIFDDYLAFIDEQKQLSDQFAARIKQAGTLGQNANPNYPTTELASKLKMVAKLIRGGLQTKVYHVVLGGFDTHVGQLAKQDTLFKELSGAVTAFQKDLVAMNNGVADRVTTMTFSEFGRRAQENASGGTDHGTAVPMLVFGTKLNPLKIIGKSPDLNALVNNNLPTQFDYRQTYSAYLRDWMGLSATTANDILLTNQTSPAVASFEPLPIFRPTASTAVQIKAKLLLEGFFSTTSNLMNTSLVSKNLLPKSQPFNKAPWNYAGTESVVVFPANVTDWILVVARDNAGVIKAQKAAFLTNDGNLIAPDGGTLTFADLSDFYVSFHHKSHLAVMSNKAVVSNELIDFTTAENIARGTKQLKLMGTKYVLFAGDYDGNGINNNLDYNLWRANRAAVNQYLAIDGNGDGVVNNLDYNLWKRNAAKIGSTEIQSQ